MQNSNDKSVPAFLGKLWKIVNDPSTDHLISWSPAGNSFIMQNQAQFWYELLPLYYKHNNMSSFVRQLNMYGFHKLSNVDNGSMDAEKDEIQFYHEYFQKNQPELLKLIKRKVTATKAESNNQNSIKQDDLSQVLSDVKILRGRQTSVDSQLSAMKQENAVLWRELAILRQKHLKQQQIVNKLIQFLMTIVQPSATARMGVGVKRPMQLMLHENPAKKNKMSKQSTNSNNNNNIKAKESGPTIHELDSEIDIPSEQLLDDEDVDVPEPVGETESREDILEKVNSPLTPSSSSNAAKDVNSPQPSQNLLDEASRDSNSPWDYPDFVEVEELASSNDQGQSDNFILDNLSEAPVETNNERVFLNPTTRDTLLSNLVNGRYNSSALNGTTALKKIISESNKEKEIDVSTLDLIDSTLPSDMMVAKRDDVRINSGEELDLHLESTQSEIDQFKDILNGCNSFDANALLGLFNDETPNYGLSYPQEKNSNALNDAGVDPLVSGSEVAACPTPNIIDFNELFNDSEDLNDFLAPEEFLVQPDSTTINTPLVITQEPTFPTEKKS